MQVDVAADVQRGYLTVCQPIFGQRKKLRGKEVADSETCVPAWLDFHLPPATGGEVNEVVPRSYHYQPWCPLTLCILISYSNVVKSVPRHIFFSSRKTMPARIWQTENLGHPLFINTSTEDRLDWGMAAWSHSDMAHMHQQCVTHPVSRRELGWGNAEDKCGNNKNKKQRWMFHFAGERGGDDEQRGKKKTLFLEWKPANFNQTKYPVA